MAILAVAGIGALAGLGAGAAAGLTGAALLTAAGIGFSVGELAGSALFPTKPASQVGSRLGDLTISASTYGVIIPNAYGDVRVAGNMIWAVSTGIREQVDTSSAGGGKGGKGGKGGGASSTTYTYFATFAMAFSTGPMDSVLQIWADSNLVWNTSGIIPLNAPTTNLPADESSFNFTFYNGDESQLPDPRIEADPIIGTGNAPAHRGMCYILFDDIPLANYGNRIPNITVEICTATTPSQVPIPISPATPNTAAVYAGGTQTLAIDPLKAVGYIFAITPTTIVEFDLWGMGVVAEHHLGDITGNPSDNSAGPGPMTLGADLNLYLNRGESIEQIDPNAWTKIGEYDWVGIPTPNGTVICPMAVYGDKGVVSYLLQFGGNFGPLVGLPTNAIVIFNTGGMGLAATLAGTGAPRAATFGLVGAGFGQSYVLEIGPATGFDNCAVIYLDQITVSEHGSIGLFGVVYSYEYALSNVVILNFADYDSGATGWYTGGADPGGLIYDSADDSVIFQASTVNGSTIRNTYMFKWSTTGGLVWATQMPVSGGSAPGAVNSNITGGRFSRSIGNTVFTIDAASGAVLDQVVWTSFLFEGNQTYDSATQSLVVQITPGTWARILVNRRDPLTVDLGTVFTDICEAANMPVGTFDASALDAIEIIGFVVSQRAFAADILLPLAQLYQIDAVESDYVLKFVPRGGAIQATITQDGLVRVSNDASTVAEPYVETRVQEIDLPTRFTVTYNDVSSNFQVNTQGAKRVRAPNPTVFSDQQIDLQVGICLDAVSAAQAASTLLYSTWLERHQFSFTLAPQFLYLDTADPVTLQLDTGYTARVRLGQVNLGADYSTQTLVVTETDGQYVSVNVGVTALGVPYFPISLNVVSALFLLDTPLLRDIDDVSSIGIRAYWAAAPYNTNGTWNGAQFQGSQDDVSFSNMGATTLAADWGHLENILPDVASCFHTHYAESITVTMLKGGSDLASITDLQMANDSNVAAVFKANGDIEIIQFRDVVALGGNRYTLTTLNRGRRGTDTMASGHAVGEVIVFVDAFHTNEFVLPISALDQKGFFRAVTIGMLPGTALIDTQIFHGRDKMPYAPVQVTATLSGSNIDLAWIRRTRVNGPLHDGDAIVPLNEATEAYEVDIYNVGGTAVLRTLTGLTTPAAVYTAADITADFGSTPTTLIVAVYQISAAVGRGFGRIDTLGVY